MARTDYEKMSEQVQKRINEEPGIADPSRISVRTEKAGGLLNRRRVIILEGSISNEAEGERAAEVAQAVLGGSDAVEIENRLVVPLI
ncbi:MAG: BON domain-containing protein [Spirochaetaceae bacterium]|nr:MAG: BON domain-containing protein [Spirochaetaceae bacterium]